MKLLQQVHRPAAIAAVLSFGAASFLVHEYGKFSIHGGPDGSNALGVIVFLLALPAALICRSLEGLIGEYFVWLFWPLFLLPYLVVGYFMWKRFFRWLEPEDIIHKEPPPQ